jgi:hypothetical protein
MSGYQRFLSRTESEQLRTRLLKLLKLLKTRRRKASRLLRHC